MPQRRISMQKIRDTLRYYHEKGLSKRKIATLLGLSPGTIRNYLRRAEQAHLSWPLPEDLTDAALEALLFPASKSSPTRPHPDWNAVHRQLSRKGMTLERVWTTYRTHNPDGYSYGHFCELYKEWSGTRKMTMRMPHYAGEKLFVDFAGTTIPLIDPETGEVSKAQIFVAALGCSKYMYVEAVPDQKLRSWIGAHVRAFTFFGAVPHVIVCDNLKAAVSRADRKCPDLNPTYRELGLHYGTTICAARPYHPKDKAVAEQSVKFVTNRILSGLLTGQFFSLLELNQEIAPLLAELNEMAFQKNTGTRRSQFEALDRPNMLTLPATSFAYREWKKLKASFDFHVQADCAYYSVPHQYAHQKIDVCLHENIVQCFYQSKLIATHPRAQRKWLYSTNCEHMPEKYRRQLARERFLSQARKIGPHVEQLVDLLLSDREHPEQRYRTIRGVLGLVDSYPPERLDAACSLALTLGPRACTCGSISSILKTGRDELIHEVNPDPPPILHENIRGGAYYSTNPTDEQSHS